jgi:5-methylthioribose kinase
MKPKRIEEMKKTARDSEVEPVDIESPFALLAYLREHGLVGRDESPVTQILHGGVSNRTLLVEPDGRPAFVMKQALAKLRVAVDWYSDPSRIHREALGLRLLKEITPPGTITPLLFEDTGQHIIAMVAVPRGHRNWKEILLCEGPVQDHLIQFAEILGAIHSQSSRFPEHFEQAFQDRAAFESLRLEPYYEYCATQVKEAEEFLLQLVEETRRTRMALVHADYSPKNILVHDGRLILIDHEVVHFGDPAFDMGFSLTHLLSKANHCRERRNLFLNSAELYISRYLQVVQASQFGVDFEKRACRHTLGCLLARVAGRSPLEYLSELERGVQRRAVLHLIQRPPVSLTDLIHRFGEELSCL